MSYFVEDRGTHSSVEWEAINEEEGDHVAADLRAARPPDCQLTVTVRTDRPAGVPRTRVRASARLPLLQLQTLISSMPLPGADYELTTQR